MKFLRHLLGITKLDKEKNQCFTQKTGAQNIVKEIKQYQSKWLQHVQRMDTNRLPKQALKYKSKGRRNIGRPRKRWRDQLHLEEQDNMPNPSGTWWWWWWFVEYVHFWWWFPCVVNLSYSFYKSFAFYLKFLTLFLVFIGGWLGYEIARFVYTYIYTLSNQLYIYIQDLSKRFERLKFGIFYVLIVKIRYNFTHK